MSGEFGDYYTTGYFGFRIENSASECLHQGQYPLTILWGKFLEKFTDIAHKIARSEAYDCGPESVIEITQETLPSLRDQLNKIELYCAQFNDLTRDEQWDIIKVEVDTIRSERGIKDEDYSEYNE